MAARLIHVTPHRQNAKRRVNLTLAVSLSTGVRVITHVYYTQIQITDTPTVVTGFITAWSVAATSQLVSVFTVTKSVHA